MKCKKFKPCSECKDCADTRCEINGGSILASQMCGCDYCDNQKIYGDTEKCIAVNELKYQYLQKCSLENFLVELCEISCCSCCERRKIKSSNDFSCLNFDKCSTIKNKKDWLNSPKNSYETIFENFQRKTPQGMCRFLCGQSFCNGCKKTFGSCKDCFKEIFLQATFEQLLKPFDD